MRTKKINLSDNLIEITEVSAGKVIQKIVSRYWKNNSLSKKEKKELSSGRLLDIDEQRVIAQLYNSKENRRLSCGAAK